MFRDEQNELNKLKSSAFFESHLVESKHLKRRLNSLEAYKKHVTGPIQQSPLTEQNVWEQIELHGNFDKRILDYERELNRLGKSLLCYNFRFWSTIALGYKLFDFHQITQPMEIIF